MAEGWISIPDWRRFQHYDPAKRQPPWIKVYLELLSDDEYLALSEHRALLLHRLWLEYAASRCRLSLGTLSTGSRGSLSYKTLSSRLSLRVTRADIESLCDAGFIEIVASKTLAEGYHDASKTLASRAPARSLEAEAEEEKDLRQAVTSTTDVTPEPDREGLPVAQELQITNLLTAIGAHADNGTETRIRRYARKLPEAAIAKVAESTLAAHVENRGAYACQALQDELRERAQAHLVDVPRTATIEPVGAPIVERFVAQLAQHGHPWDAVETLLEPLLARVPDSERPALHELAETTYREASAA